MSGPKVVVLGAGSLFFGRQALWQILRSKTLREGTLAYVDTDPGRQEKMMGLAKLVIADQKSPLKLEGSTDRREVLSGADYIVLTFANRGPQFRGLDVRVSAKYGVRMCGGDSIGPGGIFRTLRELPEVLRVAKDVEELCPDAWVINYINPTATMGMGLKRYTKTKSFALCDGHHLPYLKRRLLEWTGVVPHRREATPAMVEKLDLKIAGVNHFTWMLAATYEGQDVMPALRRHLEGLAAEEKDEGYSKARFKHSSALEMWDVFGAYPDFMAHSKEYLPYWQRPSVAPGRLPPLDLFSPEERLERHDQMWADVDGYLAGKIPASEFKNAFMMPDYATDVVESMHAGQVRRCYVNTDNRGAVTNMADDAFLELECDLDAKQGPRPLPVGPFPKGLHALQQQVLETHELTVEAAVTCDRGLLRRAMLLDPIVNSVPDADAIIAELMEKERDALPDCWFSRRETS